MSDDPMMRVHTWTADGVQWIASDRDGEAVWFVGRRSADGSRPEHVAIVKREEWADMPPTEWIPIAWAEADASGRVGADEPSEPWEYTKIKWTPAPGHGE